MKGKVRNIGPKSAAWLRQVGIHSIEELTELGAVASFIRIKRAGFRPSLNLLYALEGALLDCHWQEIPDTRRSELILAADAASVLLPPARGKQVHNAPVSTTYPDAAAADTAQDGSEPE